MATSIRGFVIYGRDKIGGAWRRFEGAQTYSRRADAEYAMRELESKPNLSHLVFEVRAVSKPASGFKDSQQKRPTFKKP